MSAREIITLAALVLGLGFWFVIHPLSGRPRPEATMPSRAPYPYVHIDAAGAARELHASERKYLETEFKGGDGDMPYVKDSYGERNGWGDLRGYLKRALLPPGTAIAPAPADDPLRPRSRQETIDWLRNQGVAVTEHSDGSFTTRAKPRQ
jgi:hypothetical protein